MSKILLKAFLTIRWYYMMFETGFNISIFAPLYFRYHGQRPIKKMIFTLKIWFVITTTSTSALIFKLKKIHFFAYDKREERLHLRLGVLWLLSCFID